MAGIWRPLLWAGAVLAAVAAPGGGALAHPHVFIDTGVELQFDTEGRLEALRIVWVYDDFVSLMIVAERGLDADGDGVLTEAETAALTGFDMQWDEGFAGDTYLLSDGRDLALGPPEAPTATYLGGRVVTTHFRRLAEPLAPGDTGLVVQFYDPGYYTAYTVASVPVIAGRDDCSADLFGPDLAAAAAQLAEALGEFSGADPEYDFPAIGAAYAEEVRIACRGGS